MLFLLSRFRFFVGVCVSCLMFSAGVCAQQAPAAPAGKTEKVAKTAAAKAKAEAVKGQDKTKVPPPGPAELPLFGERAFNDARSKLTFTTPPGWMVIEVPQLQDGEISKLFLEGPGSPPASCGLIVQGVKHPNVTQAQLNKLLHDDRNAANIKNNLSQGGRTLASMRKISQGGVAGIQGVVMVSATAQQPAIATILTFFEAVNRRYTFNCNVLAGDLDTQRTDIEALIKSVQFP